MRGFNTGVGTIYGNNLVSDSSNVFNRADMQCYVIYWQIEERYFLIVLDRYDKLRTLIYSRRQNVREGLEELDIDRYALC